MRNEIDIDQNKPLFSQALSVILIGKRTDRPDEWSMDELADIAADNEKHIAELTAALELYKEANERLKVERDELAAHCKALLDTLNEVSDTFMAFDTDAFNLVYDANKATPAHSLAENNAKVIEDAAADLTHRSRRVEDMAQGFGYCAAVVDLEGIAITLRKQAKEKGNDT
jgi:hypothetical protein